MKLKNLSGEDFQMIVNLAVCVSTHMCWHSIFTCLMVIIRVVSPTGNR